MMKSLVSILFLVICLQVSAQEIDSLFQAGNQAYAQKNYAKAYIIYDGLIREGVQNSSLWINFSNSCMQLNLPEKAIAYYEKALLRDPNNQQIKDNLSFARDQLDVEDSNPRSLLSQWNESYVYISMVIVTWILIFILLMYFVKKGIYQKKRVRVFLVLFGVIAIFFYYQGLQCFLQNHIRKYAIVQSEMVIHKQPAELSSEIYDVLKGQKVQVLDIQNGWAKIKAENSHRGWVSSDHLIVIK